MKKLLLITSEFVQFTGTVSFKYIFEADGVYDKHPKECSGPYGYIHSNFDGTTALPFNLFQGGSGLILAGAFGQGDDDDMVEHMPEACNMICTVEVADELTDLLKDKMEVLRFHCDKPLKTAYSF